MPILRYINTVSLLAFLVFVPLTAQQGDGSDTSTASSGLSSNEQAFLKQIGVQLVPQTFEERFGNDDDITLQELKEYQEDKQDALTDMWNLKSTLWEKANDYNSYIQENSRNIRDLTEAIRDQASSNSSAISYNGASISETDARTRIANLQTMMRSDSTQYANYSTAVDVIDQSINNVEADLSRSRTRLSTAIAKEVEQHSFKMMTSLSFLTLIGIIILAFFATLFVRSRDNQGVITSLLNEKGLQFITLFVLIIAVVLFGILGVLEGRELAAILSGIAGYVLGRGTIGGKGSDDATASDAPASTSVNTQANQSTQSTSTSATIQPARPTSSPVDTVTAQG